MWEFLISSVELQSKNKRLNLVPQKQRFIFLINLCLESCEKMIGAPSMTYWSSVTGQIISHQTESCAIWGWVGLHWAHRKDNLSPAEGLNLVPGHVQGCYTRLQPARELAWRSPWGQSWKGWLCHPPSLCVFSSETSQSKDMTHATYWQ